MKIINNHLFKTPTNANLTKSSSCVTGQKNYFCLLDTVITLRLSYLINNNNTKL